MFEAQTQEKVEDDDAGKNIKQCLFCPLQPPTPFQLKQHNISFWALLHGMRKL